MLFLSEADVKKDSNFTIEIVSHVLTRLQAMFVNLASTDFHMVFDNTCRENKNNNVFRDCMYLTATKLVRSCTALSLMAGHTHKDIDQMLGRACKYVEHI